MALKAPSFNNRARKRRHEGSEEEESVEESERDLEDKDYGQSGSSKEVKKTSTPKKVNLKKKKQNFQIV